MTRPARPLTIVAAIDPARHAELAARLAEIGADVIGNARWRPAELPATHFTRLVIVDDAPRDELAPLLAWETNHDGAAADYLRAVARAAAAPGARLGFDELFGCCPGYPARGVHDEDAWVRWMRRHAVRTEAFHCAYPDATKRQVDNDLAVHAAIRAYLDARRDELGGLAPVEIQARIRDHLRGLPALDVAPLPDRGAIDQLRRVAGYVGLGIVALALLIPVVIPFYVILRRRERVDPADTFDRAVHGDPDLIDAEDHIIQNQLTHVVDVKPGWFRYILLRGTLAVIHLLARIEYRHGHLGGITSIHFARWLILHDRRRGVARRRHRLVFFSNYDFSWDSYLGEFVDRQATGLTAVWSNTEGYPPARGLIREGAEDEERFKSWARSKQRPSQVWWSGVRHASVENVRTAIAVRAGVARRLTDTELPAWLRRL